MIFHQLFEPETSTFTYLLGCPESGDAVLIDPVREMAARDLAEVQRLGLTLTHTVETHVHADHVTAAARLRSLTGCRVACPAIDGRGCADIGLREGEALTVGTITLHPLFTPGHTDAHHSYLIDRADGARLFTGDALLIDGCGRTDFQNGDAAALYHSVRDKLFAFAGETLVYPAHDYAGRRVSSIAQERARNPRLGDGRTLAEFIAIMDNLDLPYPKMIDIAVPANALCGADPSEP
ncbi:MAG: MBL fold metallo-hydrolase [Sphingopyxis sp.]|nr:MBL fold metallo-hydrolase [Sphingopyxis sp.]